VRNESRPVISGQPLPSRQGNGPVVASSSLTQMILHRCTEDCMTCLTSGNPSIPSGQYGCIHIRTKNRWGGATQMLNHQLSFPSAEQSTRRRFDYSDLPARLSLPSSLLESCSGLCSAAVFAVGHSRYHIPFQGALLSLCGKRLIDVHDYS
jgi:hypothetical protein